MTGTDIVRTEAYEETGIQVGVNRSDQYVNMTHLCRAVGADWKQTQKRDWCIEYLKAAELKGAGTGTIYVTKGRTGGSWLHRDAALWVAGHLRPKFAVWMMQQISRQEEALGVGVVIGVQRHLSVLR